MVLLLTPPLLPLHPHPHPQARAPVGTCYYMAPEVLLLASYRGSALEAAVSRRVCEKMDVWSLGVSLFELAAGVHCGLLGAGCWVLLLLGRRGCACPPVPPREQHTPSPVARVATPHRTTPHAGYKPFQGASYEGIAAAVIQHAMAELPPHVSPGFRAFIAAALTYDPMQRPSAQQLHGHPWIQLHVPAPSRSDSAGSLIDVSKGSSIARLVQHQQQAKHHRRCSSYDTLSPVSAHRTLSHAGSAASLVQHAGGCGGSSTSSSCCDGSACQPGGSSSPSSSSCGGGCGGAAAAGAFRCISKEQHWHHAPGGGGGGGVAVAAAGSNAHNRSSSVRGSPFAGPGGAASAAAVAAAGGIATDAGALHAHSPPCGWPVQLPPLAMPGQQAQQCGLQPSSSGPLVPSAVIPPGEGAGVQAGMASGCETGLCTLSLRASACSTCGVCFLLRSAGTDVLQPEPGHALRLGQHV